jgi:ABC-type phosphate/phosphonate transport system substrate-binding protein
MQTRFSAGKQRNTPMNAQLVSVGRFFPGRAGLVLTLLLPLAPAAHGQSRVNVLHIGATGTLTGRADSPMERAGVDTLRVFIKEETGFDSEIAGQLKWDDLAARLAKRQVHVAVFQGFEFAWAKKRDPELKALALAVNRDRYPVAIVLTRRISAVKDFAGLRGRSLSLTVTSLGFLRLFIDRQCTDQGKGTAAFFSKIASADNFEDALDDVVDGLADATVVDRVALAAYEQRKPGRYQKLVEVARSEPFPPLVVAYYASALDEGTLNQFRDGLLGATDKDKGKRLLNLSKLTAFEPIPSDFARVLAETRKAFPAP